MFSAPMMADLNTCHLIKNDSFDSREMCWRTAYSAEGEKPQPFHTQFPHKLLTEDPNRNHLKKTVHLTATKSWWLLFTQITFFNAVPVSITLFLSCTHLAVSFSCFSSRCAINPEVNLRSKVHVCIAMPQTCTYTQSRITKSKWPPLPCPINEECSDPKKSQF